MKISSNISLKNLNTFSLDYSAQNVIEINTEEEAIRLFQEKKLTEGQYYILGGGSNILLTRNFKGTIILPEIKGIMVEKKDNQSVIISSGAGVKWDDLVEWSVEKGFYGLENLSLIPGNVGATPVQNIGAYGAEVKDSIFRVKAVSLEDGSIKYFSNEECLFGYRSSIFKEGLKGKYMITRVYYKLSAIPFLKLDYGSLQEELKKIGEINLKNIRQAVINIRRSKLPDPDEIGNAGSFFKNPVVSQKTAEDLKKIYSALPIYNDKPGFIKLAAGWLIDQCGWKGYRKGDAGVHAKQALVLVNYGNALGKEIFDLSEEIRISVKGKFGVDLHREVEVI
jgi:UDP-N-acetylmuramate dehydrogenase